MMTFRFEKGSGDIYLVQELLGHRSVATTQKYLGVNYAEAREAVEGMALASQPYRVSITTGTKIIRMLGEETVAVEPN